MNVIPWSTAGRKDYSAWKWCASWDGRHSTRWRLGLCLFWRSLRRHPNPSRSVGLEEAINRKVIRLLAAAH